MSYLTAAEYRLVRSDPSSIVNLYAQHRQSFIAQAHLQGAPESIQIASFASVVAHGLVPYGASKALTFPELLSAKFLSCAQYVRLTMWLTEEFHRTDIAYNAVGWDYGNSVANHSQLFVRAEGASVLLDPTIGLIVRGATLPAVANGVRYGSGTSVSFYDSGRTEGSDIDQFNATVQKEIAAGTLRHKYLIYDAPSPQEFELNFGAHGGSIIGSARSGTQYNDVFDWSGTAWGGRGNDAITGGNAYDKLYGGDGNDSLFGNEGADSLNGENGDDWLNGGLGNDRMVGGLGNDVYVVEGSDKIIEQPNEGRDWMMSDSFHVRLAANVEVGKLVGEAALNLFGNTLDNRLYGNVGANIIIGGLGQDVMTGDAGADRFKFNSIGEIGNGAQSDIIMDFIHDEDKLQFSGIDANAKQDGRQSFVYIGKSAFSGQGGELHYTQSGANIIVAGDVNGDRVADFQVVLRHTSLFGPGDFIS